MEVIAEMKELLEGFNIQLTSVICYITLNDIIQVTAVN